MSTNLEISKKAQYVTCRTILERTDIHFKEILNSCQYVDDLAKKCIEHHLHKIKEVIEDMKKVK